MLVHQWTFVDTKGLLPYVTRVRTTLKTYLTETRQFSESRAHKLKGPLLVVGPRPDKAPGQRPETARVALRNVKVLSTEYV